MSVDRDTETTGESCHLLFVISHLSLPITNYRPQRMVLSVQADMI